jgi:deoxyribodipyrimidine photo-lyase
LRATWHPGEAGAAGRLDRFLDQGLDGYGRRRDLPAVAATSMLSPYLHWGEISPRQLWHAVEAAAHHDHARRADADKFLAEMGWREFSYHLLFTNPDLRTAPLRPEFRDFPWDRSHKALLAWQKGMTGYPLVDAGMRQLWHTGWMHNRVRMIAASFLIKHLLLPWQSGEAWFWDCLVDADEASNGASWQWVAGCGADAAPYFRIFNPVIQGRKFDPEGDYIRRWVPELAHRPASAIHEPSGDIDGYPAPIIDHEYARHRALEALKTMKSQSGTEEIA